MLELVRAIKDGDRERLAEFYDRNTGLLYKLAVRYRGIDPAVSEDDLMQAGFLGLVAAVDAWEPARGAWSTIATPYVKNAMRAAVGLRGTRQRAHLGTVSLDAPIPGSKDEDSTRADLLEDESLPDPDEQILKDERRAAIREAVGRLQGRKREVVELHDLEGLTYECIGAMQGMTIERVRQLRVRAFQDLRRDRQLGKALDEETRFHAHKSLTSFLSDWTSTTEALAMWRIERQERSLERES